MQGEALQEGTAPATATRLLVQGQWEARRAGGLGAQEVERVLAALGLLQLPLPAQQLDDTQGHPAQQRLHLLVVGRWQQAQARR